MDKADTDKGDEFTQALVRLGAVDGRSGASWRFLWFGWTRVPGTLVVRWWKGRRPARVRPRPITRRLRGRQWSGFVKSGRGRHWRRSNED